MHNNRFTAAIIAALILGIAVGCIYAVGEYQESDVGADAQNASGKGQLQRNKTFIFETKEYKENYEKYEKMRELLNDRHLRIPIEEISREFGVPTVALDKIKNYKGYELAEYHWKLDGNCVLDSGFTFAKGDAPVRFTIDFGYVDNGVKFSGDFEKMTKNEEELDELKDILTSIASNGNTLWNENDFEGAPYIRELSDDDKKEIEESWGSIGINRTEHFKIYTLGSGAYTNTVQPRKYTFICRIDEEKRNNDGVSENQGISILDYSERNYYDDYIECMENCIAGEKKSSMGDVWKLFGEPDSITEKDGLKTCEYKVGYYTVRFKSNIFGITADYYNENNGDVRTFSRLNTNRYAWDKQNDMRRVLETYDHKMSMTDIVKEFGAPDYYRAFGEEAELLDDGEYKMVSKSAMCWEYLDQEIYLYYVAHLDPDVKDDENYVYGIFTTSATPEDERFEDEELMVKIKE